MALTPEEQGLWINLKFEFHAEYLKRVETMRQEWKSKMKRLTSWQDDIFTLDIPTNLEMKASFMDLEGIPSIWEMFKQLLQKMKRDMSQDQSPY